MRFSSPKLSLLILFFVSCLAGCNTGPSPVDLLKDAHEQMKAPSADFEAALASVVDEESAKAALPKLNAASKNMVEASKLLEKAMASRSRKTVAVRKEIEDFREEQKQKVRQHVIRINQLPEAKKVLKDVLQRISLQQLK